MRIKIKKVFLRRAAAILTVFSILFFSGCGSKSSEKEPAAQTKWTIMYYGDADCDLESYLMLDIAEMKNGIVDDQGVNVILLVDRISSYSNDSETLGQNFTDTRLYRITSGKAWRIGGSTQFPEITKGSTYEANMGDAETLKKFIRFCKANYQAENYALIFSNHGGGPKKKKSYSAAVVSGGDTLISKNICYDASSGNDFLYTAEISDGLTSSESVQLLGLDACLMSSVEFAYQFRNDSGNTGFKAEIMVASAPAETGYGWDYEAILDRLQAGGSSNGTADLTLGGSELYYDPASLTARQLGAVIVEEQRDSTELSADQSLTCIDLSKITAVKTAVDDLAKALIPGNSSNDRINLEALRGSDDAALVLHYFDDSTYSSTYAAYTDWIFTPFFDLYNLAAAIKKDSTNFSTVATRADAIKTAVDDLVLYSFANSDFSSYSDPFIEGMSGVHIFFPDGDATYKSGGITHKHWYIQDWYNALGISAEYTGAPYGKLAWCIDGINSTASDAGNWFELLDSWFDSAGSEGDNYYEW